jgi:hypothetical protein
MMNVPRRTPAASLFHAQAQTQPGVKPIGDTAVFRSGQPATWFFSYPVLAPSCPPAKAAGEG